MIPDMRQPAMEALAASLKSFVKDRCVKKDSLTDRRAERGLMAGGPSGVVTPVASHQLRRHRHSEGNRSNLRNARCSKDARSEEAAAASVT